MSIWQEQSQSRMICHSKILPQHTLACVAMATVILGEPLQREFSYSANHSLEFQFSRQMSFILNTQAKAHKDEYENEGQVRLQLSSNYEAIKWSNFASLYSYVCYYTLNKSAFFLTSVWAWHWWPEISTIKGFSKHYFKHGGKHFLPFYQKTWWMLGKSRRSFREGKFLKRNANKTGSTVQTLPRAFLSSTARLVDKSLLLNMSKQPEKKTRKL